MEKVYKMALSILIVILSFFLMLKDILFFQSLDIRNLQIFVLAITISLICWTHYKNKKLIFGSIFLIFFVTSTLCSVICGNKFGTTQPISALQGYLNVVKKGDLYYRVPIHSITYKANYGEPDIFITQKITDVTMLETILKDYYSSTETNNLIIEEDKNNDTKEVKNYKITIDSKIVANLYLHTYDSYSWFRVR